MWYGTVQCTWCMCCVYVCMFAVCRVWVYRMAESMVDKVLELVLCLWSLSGIIQCLYMQGKQISLIYNLMTFYSSDEASL